MEIRSYRRVFDLERRVYSVDRLRLNPGGVPVRGVLYFLAVVAASLLAAGLPGVGVAARVLPWYLRDLLLPGLAATLMGAIRVEGRNFHHAALGLLRLASGRRPLVQAWRAAPGARWRPPDVLLIADGSDGRLRHLRYTGPGAVLVSVAHERRGRAREQGSRAWARRGARAEISLHGARTGAGEKPPRIILLGAGVKLRVRGERASRS